LVLGLLYHFAALVSVGVFAVASGPMPFAPAANRIYVRFSDASGTVRGSTSVAVRTR